MDYMSLEEIHGALLEVFKDIDRVCRENDIKYTAIGGTLIGALRHKGIIPWDDDIDIAIPRENYYRFIDIYEKKKGDGFKLYEYHKNDDYTLAFAKISNLKTRVVYEYGDFPDDMGLAIDVVPMDKKTKPFLSLKRKYIYYLYKKVCVAIGAPSPSARTGKIKTFLKRYIIRKSPGYYLSKMEDYLVKENNTNKDYYIGLFCGASTDKRGLMPKKASEEYTDLDFEDTKIMAVKGYDEFLTLQFGDYMTLPPEEKRHPHPCKAYWVNTV